MEEYQKQKADQQERAGKSTVLQDEAEHRVRMQQQARQRETTAMQLLKSTMSREKVQEMKHQADLRAQMQTAFKTGDKKTYERLKERLAADEK